jgi:asparagine synthase (glutamine-hydrolysing)
MCGIAGFVARDRELPKDAGRVIRAMVSSLARRGPDSEGIESWPSALLGHRRLAIIDLSDAGRQPMLSDDGEIGLVFNGCIYNFHELRREIEAFGHSFRSNCDTEVVLRGYQQWGIDVLVRKLRGMFAFGIWDNRLRKLFLVRDRLGVKPLVYAIHGAAIAFASTVEALSATGMTEEIDPQAVLEFLEFGFITNRSIYLGISKLPAASILEWQDGRTAQRSYWTLPHPDENSRVKFSEAVEETERLLLEAVRLRLEADVSIGALLSGGIDSTLVCWALAKLGANVKAFTVTTEGDPFDEGPDARETAHLLGIPHEMVTIPHEQPPPFNELMEAYGEPFGCSSALAMLRVSRAVKPLATVLLTGDGGDDVFLGYPLYRRLWMAQRLAHYLPGPASSVWRTVRPLANRLPFLRRPKHFLDYATGGLGAVTRVHNGLPYYDEYGMLGDRLAGRSLEDRRIPLATSPARKLFSDVLDYEQRTRFVGEFLTKVDGGTMRYALEARSPLLDQKIWEFAAALPIRLRLRGGILKAILREIVRKNIGPTVAFRKKQGFTVPVENWLATRWSSSLRQLTEGSLLEDEGWIRKGAVRDAVSEGIERQWIPTQLWYLLVLEQWLRKHPRAVDSPSTVDVKR